MMRGKAGALLIILGALLVAGALGLIAYNIHDDYRAGDAAADALRQLAPQLPQDVPAAEPAISTEGESQEADAAGVYLDPTRQMPVKMIEGREYTLC